METNSSNVCIATTHNDDRKSTRQPNDDAMPLYATIMPSSARRARWVQLLLSKNVKTFTIQRVPSLPFAFILSLSTTLFQFCPNNVSQLVSFRQCHVASEKYLMQTTSSRTFLSPSRTSDVALKLCKESE